MCFFRILQASKAWIGFLLLFELTATTSCTKSSHRLNSKGYASIDDSDPALKPLSPNQSPIGANPISMIEVRNLRGPVAITESGLYVVVVNGNGLSMQELKWRVSLPNLIIVEECTESQSAGKQISCRLQVKSLPEGAHAPLILFARQGQAAEVSIELLIVPFRVGVRKIGQNEILNSLSVAANEEFEIVAQGAGLHLLFLGWGSSNHALISTDSCYGTGAGARVTADSAQAVCRVRASDLPQKSNVQITGIWMPSEPALRLSRAVVVQIMPQFASSSSVVQDAPPRD